MKPPYEITTQVLKQISSISEKIGEAKANFLNRPSPQLRKQNKIKTIHSSLKIEGNTLSEEQITALIEKKRVIGPKKDIMEVMNAIDVYDHITSFQPNSISSFLLAHQKLMNGLVEKPGRFRTDNVGIVQGSKIAHLAPPSWNVLQLMENLFDYLNHIDELILIKSCVFHYEMEFIYPFLDGNGRMGRLWQSVILLNEYPIFEFLPFETMISKTQEEYYTVLSHCDKAGNSTLFIIYMLGVIENALTELLKYNNRTLTDKDRLDYFISLNQLKFSRKDYMNTFKDISSATASRDLKKGVEQGLFIKKGDKNNTIYEIIK
ncbi:Fic family protein [Flexithrix dorotheae]|uniref:Fic family protein n=1 Tax=Flexithrix dorotheae TaxID=70993 RepID=UPI00035CEAF8|nr:Fic family protein [Flexithrix dorotheae]